MKNVCLVVSCLLAVGVFGCSGGQGSCQDCNEISSVEQDATCRDECGEPDPPDSDGDGVEDSVDACLEQPETWNGYQDTDGCPDEAPSALFPENSSGQWTREMTVAIGGSVFSDEHTMTLRVNADRQSAILSGFCPDGSGGVTLAWKDGAGVWGGNYICPPAPWEECSRLDAIFFEFRVTFTSSETMIAGAGVADMDDEDTNVSTRCDVPANEMSLSTTVPRR
jgi:hypothetical protein